MYGWKYNPGKHKSRVENNLTSVEINNEGFRDDDFNQKLKKNKKNIIFIGDSVTAAIEVNVENRFSNLTKEYFKKNYEVFNLGISGFATDQIYLLLKDYIDIIKPKYIFYTFVDNDVMGLNKSYISDGKNDWGKPYFDQNLNLIKKSFDKRENRAEYFPEKSKIEFIKKFLRQHSGLYNFLMELKDYYLNYNFKRISPEKKYACGLNLKGREYERYMNVEKLDDQKYISEWNNNWDLFEILIQEINQLALKYNSKFFIIEHIDPFKTSEILRDKLQSCTKRDLNFKYTSEKLKNVTKKNNINLINTSIKENINFQIQNNCEINFLNEFGYIIDGHLTSCGHKLIADKILKLIH